MSEAQQLNLAVHYLRQVHCYCFYSSTQCKDHGELIALTGDGFQLITESDEDPKVDVDGEFRWMTVMAVCGCGCVAVAVWLWLCVAVAVAVCVCAALR